MVPGMKAPLMTRPPALTDRSALNRNRQRALQNGDFFAHAHIAAEFQERLNEVNRTFTRPAIVTGFPHLWADFLPNATLVPDGEILDLQPGAHDLIIDALTLHWADDPVGQLVQARRALLPDGMYLAALPGGQTLSELRSALAEAEVALTGGLSPRVLPMAEIRDLGALLQRAGFALPVADSVLQTASYRDLRHLASDLRAMGEGNALMQRLRRPAPRGGVPGGRPAACGPDGGRGGLAGIGRRCRAVGTVDLCGNGETRAWAAGFAGADAVAVVSFPGT
jgi:SAM-dependent methyltransferase